MKCPTELGQIKSLWGIIMIYYQSVFKNKYSITVIK